MTLPQPTPADLFALTQRVRQRRPLVHCLTNHVASNFAANCLLAIGASPAMCDKSSTAAADFVHSGIVASVAVNAATAPPHQKDAIRAAAMAADERALPWVVDPCGCGAHETRILIQQLMKQKPTALRANASEVAMLAEAPAVKMAGPDAVIGVEEALPYALELSRRGPIVALSGPIDHIISSQLKIGAALQNGHPMLCSTTATGCSLGAICAAYLGVVDRGDPLAEWMAVLAAHAHVALAGEMAAKEARGPGTFAVAFLDNLAAITVGDFEERIKLEIYEVK